MSPLYDLVRRWKGGFCWRLNNHLPEFNVPWNPAVEEIDNSLSDLRVGVSWAMRVWCRMTPFFPRDL